MIDALLSPGNVAFTGAIAVMLLIAAVEGVGALLGTSISEHLRSLLPETDLNANLEIDASEAIVSPFRKALAWLRVGQVPVLMLLVAFLTIFGLGGLVLQSVVMEILGRYLPSGIAVPVAFAGSLLPLRAAGGVIARVIPLDETDAVTEDSFIGSVATITLGTARRGEPAEAKLRDVHGHTHYVMVEPDDPQASFAAPKEVLIVRRLNNRFAVIDLAREMIEDTT
jgi:hypothetical protein